MWSDGIRVLAHVLVPLQTQSCAPIVAAAPAALVLVLVPVLVPAVAFGGMAVAGGLVGHVHVRVPVLVLRCCWS